MMRPAPGGRPHLKRRSDTTASSIPPPPSWACSSRSAASSPQRGSDGWQPITQTGCPPRSPPRLGGDRVTVLRYCPRCRARRAARTFLEGDRLVGRCSLCGLVLATSPDKPPENPPSGPQDEQLDLEP